jgi:hypothetical protein
VKLLGEQHANAKPQMQKALARIQRSVREMADLTDSLLLLSREEGRGDAAHRRRSASHESQLPNRFAAACHRSGQHGGDGGSNLIRNALQHCNHHGVQCELKPHRLLVHNAGNIAAE